MSQISNIKQQNQYQIHRTVHESQKMPTNILHISIFSMDRQIFLLTKQVSV